MKIKIFNILLFIIIFFLMFSITTKAAEKNVLYTKSPLTITGNKITLKLYVNSTHEISGALFPWSFDQEKLKLVSIKSSNFSATYKNLEGKYTRNILLDSYNEYNGEIELLEIVFETTNKFKENDTAVIKFGSGQIANYKKTSNIAGAEFKVTKEKSGVDITYSVVPVVKTLENNNTNNELAEQLDAKAEEQQQASQEESSNQTNNTNNTKNKGNINAEDTGYFTPLIEMIALGGMGLLIYKKTNRRLFQI